MLATVVAAAAGYAISTSQSAVYQAEGSVLLSDPRGTAVLTDPFTAYIDQGRYVANEAEVFTSRPVAVRASELLGGDPDANARLRLAISDAKAARMPKDTIERTIKKATGELEGVSYEEIRYEGYGVGGAAVIVDCLSDNRNRTAADVRHAFSKYGGNLGSDGSVSFLFDHCGVISYPAGCDEDAIMEAALEAGAEDVVTNDDGSVDARDVLLASRAVLGLSPLSGPQKARGNVAPLVNGQPQSLPDDAFTLADLLLIQSKALAVLNF